MNDAIKAMKQTPGFYFLSTPAGIREKTYSEVQVLKDGTVCQLDSQRQRDGILSDEKWGPDTIVSTSLAGLMVNPAVPQNTLGYHRDMSASVFGPTSAATEFLDGKIKEDSHGRDGIVIMDEGQLVLLLVTLHAKGKGWTPAVNCTEK